MNESAQPLLPAPPRFKPYPAYKDSGVEWLGEIPVGWEVKRLRSTLTSCQNGVWGDEPDGIHDVVCVRVADFDRVRFSVDIAEPTLRSIDPGVVAARGLRPGDLLLEKSGGGENQPVGAVVLYDHTTPAVCSNFVARVTLAERHDPRFLTYLHAALYALRVNTRHIKQSTGIQNLDSASYLSESTGLPSEPEQRAIAALLDRETARIDALVGKKQRLIALLQEQRTAIISRAVTRGLDPTVPMKDSGVDWLGEIPTHWEVKPLKRVFWNLDSMRIPVSGEERATMTKEYPYYGASGIIDHVEDYLFEEPLILVAEDGANLYSRSTTLAFVSTGRYWVNNHAHILKPLDGDVSYWAQVLSSIVFDPWISGSAQPKLTGEKLGSIPLPVLPPVERRAIVTFLDRKTAHIDSLVAKVRDAIDRLKELRTALISAAVTGKIDVREEVA